MIRSLFSAVSGLKGHQTMLDVIGNNIANVNTQSFKSSRVIFSDLYYQTLSGASTPTATSGGSNPTQIGYGSLISSIDVVNSRSSFQQTSRALDAYISGEGYFVVQSSTSTDKTYTRLGAFSFDAKGNLLDSEGNNVMGVVAAAPGGALPDMPATADTLANIQIPNIQNYTSVTILPDGTVTGIYTATDPADPLADGPYELARLGIAVFPNPNGLTQAGTSTYQATGNSGIPAVAVAGSAFAGTLVTGGLEMSNVDLSKEFTDMIIAQRGFQANARVITTSDQVLEELVNLKR